MAFIVLKIFKIMISIMIKIFYGFLWPDIQPKPDPIIVNQYEKLGKNRWQCVRLNFVVGGLQRDSV